MFEINSSKYLGVWLLSIFQKESKFLQKWLSFMEAK